jgi:LysM repeat protein
MSTPNPLIPQGSLQSSGTSNVRIAVATIVAIHVVFFGGLLLQGCKRDAKTTDGDTKTNEVTNAAALPAEAPAGPSTTSAFSSAPASNASPLYADPTPRQTNVAQNDPWRSSNLGATASGARPDAAPAGAKEYTVARGDTYERIARANGTTVAAIRQANPNVEPRKIQPGQKINLPAGAPAASASASAGGGNDSNGAAGGKVYVVKSGDNLTKIAREHGVTISQLRAANNLKVSRVDVGQKLKIPASTNTKPAAAKPTASAPTNTF